MSQYLKRTSHKDNLARRGEMAERTKAPVSKTGIRATVSWVRIPLSPPNVSPYLDSKCVIVGCSSFESAIA